MQLGKQHGSDSKDVVSLAKRPGVGRESYRKFKARHDLFRIVCCGRCTADE